MLMDARRENPVGLGVIVHGQPICLIWFVHVIRRAASRAACTAGNNKAIKMPIIVMTTNSSTNVNAARLTLLEELARIASLLKKT